MSDVREFENIKDYDNLADCWDTLLSYSSDEWAICICKEFVSDTVDSLIDDLESLVYELRNRERED